MVKKKPNRYQALIQHIFFDHYKEGIQEITWKREALKQAAEALDIALPKNLGDAVYAIRYRTELPQSILNTQPGGMEWIIEGIARGEYAFRLVKFNRVVPRDDLLAIKIPDATPEVIRMHAQNDEQALLAITRYNRLIDIFLGITTYSLQNHWRTTISGGVQIEIDEIYIGIDTRGCHYVIPVQAKGGSDQIGIVQTRQDLQCCAEKFPGFAVRAVSAQFMEDNKIAMFEITIDGDAMKVVEERHYSLVPADSLGDAAIRNYHS